MLRILYFCVYSLSMKLFVYVLPLYCINIGLTDQFRHTIKREGAIAAYILQIT